MHLVVPPGGCFPETRRIELGPQALTIGRSPSCDVRVDSPGVDDEHAKISEIALVAIGADCAVGDVPLDAGHRRLVMPGDEIQIGSIVVALEGDDPSIAPPPMTDDVSLPAVTRRMVGAPPHAPKVRVVEGANFGDELVLQEENREYVIGRSPKADLVVEDREVSREHVKVLRKGFTIYLKDQSSTRGSWLGRSAVYQGSTVEWARPRMLRIGATVLSLELPEAVRRTVPGAQASAPMTPPPRSRGKGGLAMTPAPGAAASGSAPPNAASQPPGSGAPGAIAAADPSVPGGALHYAAHANGVGAVNAGPSAGPGGSVPPPAMGGSAPPPATAMRMGSVPPAQPRKAWKATGPTIGRASGLLLLALAGLAILGVLFVVFSLLE